jgi:L-threonylcarbamoyladenylate synthase
MGAGGVEAAVAAIRAGKAVLLPADGVYGLCAAPYSEAPVRRLYELKGRGGSQPSAIIASSLEVLFECLPELQGRAAVIVRALLPGAYTLILDNPSRRYPWLTGSRPDTIGVRVAALPPGTQRVLDAVGAVVATSANEAGGPAPGSLDEVPERIRAACAAEIDAGVLSGVASTVLDLTGPQPVVVREGAGSAAEAIARIDEAFSASSPG